MPALTLRRLLNAPELRYAPSQRRIRYLVWAATSALVVWLVLGG